MTYEDVRAFASRLPGVEEEEIEVHMARQVVEHIAIGRVLGNDELAMGKGAEEGRFGGQANPARREVSKIQAAGCLDRIHAAIDSCVGDMEARRADATNTERRARTLLGSRRRGGDQKYASEEEQGGTGGHPEARRQHHPGKARRRQWAGEARRDSASM